MMQRALRLLAAGALLAAAPALAHAQPKHPDLTGAWQVSPYSAGLKPSDGKPIPFKPAAKTLYDAHLAATAKGDRASWDETAICIPEGLPRIMLIDAPFEIMQKPNAMYFIARNRLPWRAYFNEKLPDFNDTDPLYLGFHVAKWEGSKLVIESGGFRDTTALDDKGIPHSEKLHLTEIYALGADGKTMTVSYKIEDPDTFTRPWTAKASFRRLPASFHMPEEVCAEKLQTTAPKR
ncbi:MAG: hypothetical protein WDN45_02430 [Caulobacteraceae bacterium]